jgi:hypothetical protein
MQVAALAPASAGRFYAADKRCQGLTELLARLRRPGYKPDMAYRASLFRGGWLLPVIYVLIGAFVAASHHYYSHAHQLTGVIEAILAIVLWPLVLLGVHINI